MFESKLFLCADSSSVDVRTNSVSAFHIMEYLAAPAFPVAVARIHVIGLLNREPTDPNEIQFQLDARLGEQQLAGGPFAVNFGQQLSTRAVAVMQGLFLPGRET